MHPFSQFIQILGKGKNGTRPLSQEEAYKAMKMITCYDVEPEQLGAFLMLMRIKEETAEEVAGFTQALRESIPIPDKFFRPEIDWAAYAGKKRQLPWFLLSALVLASRGHSVLMHGMQRNDERIYIPEALEALDIDIATSLSDAEQQLKMSGFSYLPVSMLSTLTNELIATRNLFGLRPPLHTVARMLNPFKAPLSVMGVFHPNFATIHQQAARLLGENNTLICKGEGGEFERIPERSSIMYGMTNECEWSDTWGKLLKSGSVKKPTGLNLHLFRSVWDGDVEDLYGELAITGTLAWVIRAMKIETTSEAAHCLANHWWQQRHEHHSFQEAI